MKTDHWDAMHIVELLACMVLDEVIDRLPWKLIRTGDMTDEKDKCAESVSVCEIAAKELRHSVVNRRHPAPDLAFRVEVGPVGDEEADIGLPVAGEALCRTVPKSHVQRPKQAVAMILLRRIRRATGSGVRLHLFAMRCHALKDCLELIGFESPRNTIR